MGFRFRFGRILLAALMMGIAVPSGASAQTTVKNFENDAPPYYGGFSGIVGVQRYFSDNAYRDYSASAGQRFVVPESAPVLTSVSFWMGGMTSSGPLEPDPRFQVAIYQWSDADQAPRGTALWESGPRLVQPRWDAYLPTSRETFVLPSLLLTGGSTYLAVLTSNGIISSTDNLLYGYYPENQLLMNFALFAVVASNGNPSRVLGDRYDFSNLPDAMTTAAWYSDIPVSIAMEATYSVVREPSTHALMAAGLAGLAAIARRRRRALVA
jgi:hypothetical protein